MENCPETSGRPRTAWMKTIQQDLKSNTLSLNEAIDVAQNRPLWSLMSAFGATHSYIKEEQEEEECHDQKSRHLPMVLGSGVN